MKTLEELGYYFDDSDVLRTKKDDKAFVFTTQEQYEELGEVLDEEVYKLLEERCGLDRIPLKPPNSDEEDEDVSFIFASKDYQKKNTLLVLIHGSGVVRAGQWARRLIINDSLQTGTQIPYIERAFKNDWGVLVMNTNHNSTENEDLKYSETPVKHAVNAWKWFVEPSNSEKIFVVAHSRGGYDISMVLQKQYKDERLTSICLTDSPCFQFPKNIEERTNPLIVVNFLAHGSFEQFNVPEYSDNILVELYAGTKTHERSNHVAMDSVFHIFENDINASNFDEVLQTARKMVLPQETKSNVDSDEVECKKRRVE